MLGGAWFTQAFGDPAAVTPATLLQRAQAAAQEQLGLAVAPARSIVRVQQVGDGVWGSWGVSGGVPGGPGAHQLLLLQACIPQYTLGHWQRMGKAGDGDTGGTWGDVGTRGGTQRLSPSVCPSRRAHQPVPGGAAAAPQPRGRLLRRGLRQRLHRQRQSGRGAAPGGLSSPRGGGPSRLSPSQQAAAVGQSVVFLMENPL